MTHRFQPAVLLRGPISVFCCYYLSSICLYLSIVATGLCIYLCIQKNEKNKIVLNFLHIEDSFSQHMGDSILYLFSLFFFLLSIEYIKKNLFMDI